MSLDDPLSIRRFSQAEVAGWRERGVHYFVPCVSSERTIAVMALGARDSEDPLNSEDLALLMGIAGQVATALENGRLYSELRIKADELNRLREFSENIIASLNDGLVVVGLDDRILRWNAAIEQLYGVPRAGAVGRPVDDVFGGPFLTRLRAAMTAETGEVALYRVPLESRHEERHALLVNAAVAPLRTPDGKVAGTIVIIEDTTSRVKLEEQLQISEKMASIGLLAAGVAHEVNTPLTGISSYTQMLFDGASPDDPRTPLLEKIERQTFRAAKIVNGLLNLARPAQTDVVPVDVNDVVNDVISLLEHQFKGGSVQVRKELCSPSPFVPGIEHKLQQVFLNLFLNARDAMPKGGWLSISTRVEDDQVVVEVGDTGAGIPKDQLSAHLRPVLHDQAHRRRDGAWAIHHLRHRAGAPRHDRLRQCAGPWHPVRPHVPERGRLAVAGGGPVHQFFVISRQFSEPSVDQGLGANCVRRAGWLQVPDNRERRACERTTGSARASACARRSLKAAPCRMETRSQVPKTENREPTAELEYRSSE